MMVNFRTRLAIALFCALIALGGGWTAVRPVSGAACQQSLPYDDATAREVLATERPFAPADKDLFLSYSNPDWKDQEPPELDTGPSRSEAEIKQELREFLSMRFPCDPQRVLDGLAIFDNSLAEQKIPDPTLRAALAALTGTIGEPAIEFLLTEAPVSSVFFGVVIHSRDGVPTGMTATVYSMPDSTWVIVFDSLLRYNSFKSLSALLFHEMLHIETPAAGDEPGTKPDGAGMAEETIAISLESIIYMQMLLTDPSIARLPDFLTRSGNNVLALVRINSGLPGTDQLNLYVPDNTVDLNTLFSEPMTQFADYYAAAGYDGTDEAEWRVLETHGNELLQVVLPALAGQGERSPERPDYDQTTLDFIDHHQAVLSPAALMTVACTLGLNLSC